MLVILYLKCSNVLLLFRQHDVDSLDEENHRGRWTHRISGILDLSGERQDVAFKNRCTKTLFRKPYKFCQSTLSLT